MQEAKEVLKLPEGVGSDWASLADALKVKFAMQVYIEFIISVVAQLRIDMYVCKLLCPFGHHVIRDLPSQTLKAKPGQRTKHVLSVVDADHFLADDASELRNFLDVSSCSAFCVQHSVPAPCADCSSETYPYSL